ncbi:MAG: phosphopantetheine-binding protein [Eubacteriales bacterium]
MKEQIIEILMEQLDLDRDEIKDDSDFVEDLEMDSLDMMELVIEIEKKLGLTIDNEKLADIHCMNDLMDYLGE